MKTWQINKTVFKVGDFLSWQKAGNLDLSPPFQRRSVWKKGAKSYLIDTVIRGLPIPIIFIRDKQSNEFTLEPRREVVDGQQRLRTLICFIAPQILSDYKPDKDDFKILKTHNKSLANRKFNDLDTDTKQIILNYQFSVHVLPSEVSDRDVLQIFARMNSTGTKLNPQELRNAAYFGEFKTSVYDSALKYFDQWRKWKIFSDENISRMDEVELTSEFYSLMLKGITGKTQGALDKLYADYDDDGKFPQRNIIEKRFEVVMDSLDENLGEYIAQSPYKKKTLFFVLFAVLYELHFGVGAQLTHKPSGKISVKQFNSLRQIGDSIESEKTPKKVTEAVTRRTTHPAERKYLFQYIKDKLNA